MQAGTGRLRYFRLRFGNKNDKEQKMKKLIKLTVNDREHEIAVEPNLTLTHLIRYELGLTGTKKDVRQAIAAPVPLYWTGCR
jgi:methyl coenzyme M reductase subunit C-like uncharacterized protein (methanogenesis marker protein 7)